MSAIEYTYSKDKEKMYKEVEMHLTGLLDGVPYRIANLANASALLNQALKEINWVGFYLMQDGQLVLGPFQGKTACVEIKVGRGVCGSAVARDEVMLVKDAQLGLRGVATLLGVVFHYLTQVVGVHRQTHLLAEGSQLLIFESCEAVQRGHGLNLGILHIREYAQILAA